ncbi:MAG TPA: hypothetical protein VFI03_07735 [Solirubrobacterales bacterium]|nr:hypothetical protein [Solirubrobacterales bacterium]
MLLASALIFAACGTSDNEVEHAIADLPSKQLTEPECDEFDRDLDEEAYECSAAQGRGGRIKLMVYLKSGDVHLIIAWPCVSADLPWRALRRDPALRCGKVVWSRS